MFDRQPRDWALDQRYQPPLSIAVTVDIALCRLNGAVARQELNVAQRATCLVHHARGSCNERAAARVRRASVKAERFISSAKPNHDAHRPHRAAALRSDYWPPAIAELAHFDQSFSKNDVKRDGSAATLFCNLVLQLDGAADLTTGVEDHIPCQFRNFSGTKAGLHREQDDQTVAYRMPRALGEK